MTMRVDRDYLMKVEKRATEVCVERSLAVVEKMLGADGLAYGDIDLKSPAEFVSFYTDLVDRGVMTSLIVRTPKYAAQLRRRYEREFPRVALEV